MMAKPLQLLLPARVYDNYVKFQADAAAGAVCFTNGPSYPGTVTALIARCPHCGRLLVLRINFEGPPHHDESWDMESQHPLTLHPLVHHSRETGGCGWQGWLRNGNWWQ